MQKFIQNLKWLTLSAVLGIAIGGGLIAVNAWIEPTVAPPGGNIGAPINTSATGQSKSGGLVLNTGGAANGLIVQGGNVGIGTATPGQKLTVSGGDVQVETGQGRFKGWVNPGASGRAAEIGISGGVGYIYNYDRTTDTHGDFQFGAINGGVYAKADGNVGIGTPAPSTGLKLDVEGKVGATEYCDQNGNNCKAITAMGGSGWPAGSYCIMKNGVCPSGFTAKTLASSVARPEWTDSFGSASASSAGSSTFGADYYGNVHYHAYRMDLAFCCK